MTARVEQPDLFGWKPPPQRKRPAYKHTSREALRTFAPVTGELDAAILRVIRAAGPAGIICEDIERALGRKHQAVSGNLRHLVERGLVKWNGEYGRTASGRKAMCWVIVGVSDATRGATDREGTHRAGNGKDRAV